LEAITGESLKAINMAIHNMAYNLTDHQNCRTKSRAYDLEI